MSDRLKPLIATFALAIAAAACSPAAAPSAAPTLAPTPAPTPVATAAPTVAPSAAPTEAATPAPSAESVLDFSQISVENLANAFIDNDWFAEREDSTLDTGDQLILLQGIDSEVNVGIVHDGDDNLLRVTVYDGDMFASDEARFDLGIVSGILLNKTLGTEAVLWATELLEDAGEGFEERKVFGPHTVIVDAGTDAEYPKDAFVFFQDAE